MAEQGQALKCNKCTSCQFRDDKRCLLEKEEFGFGSDNGCSDYLIKEALVNYKVKKKDKKRPNKKKHTFTEESYGEW